MSSRLKRQATIARFMKLLRLACFVAASFCLSRNVYGQGFVNLDFESADVSGYSPGQPVPVGSALPGWGAYFITGGTTNALTQVRYDGISAGTAAISIIDSGAPTDFLPLQGEYSAYLFGSNLTGDEAAMISQTGLVPNGTVSLLMDVYTFYNFEVTLGGQTINMVPLQSFSNYTLYGGNISSFAGNIETLSLIAPPTGGPNDEEFDDIQFSPLPVPEPTVFGLLALGGLLFGLFRFKRLAAKLV
jgi:hypothetical protein